MGCLKDSGIQGLGSQRVAATLSQSVSAEVVDLSDNCIGDEGTEHIAAALVHLGKACAVTQVALANNRIGNRGAEALAKLLASNSTVTELNLAGNCIGHEGA